MRREGKDNEEKGDKHWEGEWEEKMEREKGGKRKR